MGRTPSSRVLPIWQRPRRNTGAGGGSGRMGNREFGGWQPGNGALKSIYNIGLCIKSNAVIATSPRIPVHPAVWHTRCIPFPCTHGQTRSGRRRTRHIHHIHHISET